MCGMGILVGRPCRTHKSRWFSAQALTWTRTSSSSSAGLGRSIIWSTSSPPGCAKAMARMESSSTLVGYTFLTFEIPCSIFDIQSGTRISNIEQGISNAEPKSRLQASGRETFFRPIVVGQRISDLFLLPLLGHGFRQGMAPEQVMNQPDHGDPPDDRSDINNDTAAGDKKNNEEQASANDGQHHRQETGAMVR